MLIQDTVNDVTYRDGEVRILLYAAHLTHPSICCPPHPPIYVLHCGLWTDVLTVQPEPAAREIDAARLIPEEGVQPYNNLTLHAAPSRPLV